MTYIDRNSESGFEHADCKFKKCNSGYTCDIFSTGHSYGNFENGTLQTVLESFHIWEKVTRGSHKKSPIISLHSFFLTAITTIRVRYLNILFSVLLVSVSLNRWQPKIDSKMAENKCGWNTEQWYSCWLRNANCRLAVTNICSECSAADVDVTAVRRWVRRIREAETGTAFALQWCLTHPPAWWTDMLRLA